jgi:hypothetical protein
MKIIAPVDVREKYRVYNSALSGARKIEPLPIQSNSGARIEIGGSCKKNPLLCTATF